MDLRSAPESLDAGFELRVTRCALRGAGYEVRVKYWILPSTQCFAVPRDTGCGLRIARCGLNTGYFSPQLIANITYTTSSNLLRYGYFKVFHSTP